MNRRQAIWSTICAACAALWPWKAKSVALGAKTIVLPRRVAGEDLDAGMAIRLGDDGKVYRASAE